MQEPARTQTVKPANLSDEAEHVLADQDGLLNAEVFLERLEQRTAEAILDMDPLTCWVKFTKWCRYTYKRLPISRCLQKISPLQRVITRISRRFGASVLGYYNLASWIVVQNFLIWWLWFGLLILPWFKHYDSKDWKVDLGGGNQTDVFSAGEMVGNVFGYVEADRDTDYTWFFYSGYPRKFNTYPVGVWYTMALLGTYLITLLFIVLDIGRRISEASGETTVSRYQLPAVAYSWDWGIQRSRPTEDMLLSTWMQIQAEFHEAMSRRKFHKDDEVMAQFNETSPWELGVVDKIILGGGIVVEFKKGKHAGEKKELPDLDPPRQRVKPKPLCCGMTAQQVKGIGGRTLSVLLCAGSLIVMYYSVAERDMLNSKFAWLSAAIVACVNAVLPFLQRKIVALEGIENTKDAVIQEVVRVFIIKMANAILLFMSITDLEDNSPGKCPGFLIGAMFMQLLVVDIVINIASTYAVGYFMYWHSGRQQFQVSTEIINTLYRQCITWMGMIYCPMMLLVSSGANFIIFLVKQHVMFETCGTPEKPINDDSADTLFKLLLLLSLVVAAVSGVSFLYTEKKFCGPHYIEGCGTNDTGSVDCSTPLAEVSSYIHNEWGWGAGTSWVFRPVVLFGVALIFIITAYFLVHALFSAFNRIERQRREYTEESKSLRELLGDMQGRLDERSPAAAADDTTGTGRGSPVPDEPERENTGKTEKDTKEVNRLVKTTQLRKSKSMRHAPGGRKRGSQTTDLATLAMQAGMQCKNDGGTNFINLEDVRPYLDMPGLIAAIQSMQDRNQPVEEIAPGSLPGRVVEADDDEV
eukprot:Hpha_TRINITY_DN15653_c0_g1::TRINITY_DN15653_c0_g1_i2::g.99438::m.99438